MARIESDPNYSSPTFSRATAAADLFKKEDVQLVASALSTHTHGTGKGLPVDVTTAIPTNSITSAMIADGTIVASDLADGAVTAAKLAADARGQVLSTTPTTSSPTTTSTSLVDVPEMVISGVFTGGHVVVLFVAQVANNTANIAVALSINVDGTDFGQIFGHTSATPNAAGTVLALYSIGTLTGAHTIKGRWLTNGGTASNYAVSRNLTVLETK